MSHDAAYLLDILLMARDARSFTEGQDKDAFLSDRKGQYAVIRCLEVIGEAVKRLSGDVQGQYPDIPWRAMARMRDLLVHAYKRVDLDELWDTLQHDLPALISSFERIIPPERKS